METFRNGGTVRFDFEWYGFGYHNHSFANDIAYPGRTFFMNSYRKAPISINLINSFGWFKTNRHKTLIFNGSITEPHSNWKFCVGRFFIAGRTPRWMIRLGKRIHYWLAVREAKRGSMRYALCGVCLNGLIEIVDGHPGEELTMCRKCGYIYDSFVDLTTIE